MVRPFDQGKGIFESKQRILLLIFLVVVVVLLLKDSLDSPGSNVSLHAPLPTLIVTGSLLSPTCCWTSNENVGMVVRRFPHHSYKADTPVFPNKLSSLGCRCCFFLEWWYGFAPPPPSLLEDAANIVVFFVLLLLFRVALHRRRGFCWYDASPVSPEDPPVSLRKKRRRRRPRFSGDKDDIGDGDARVTIDGVDPGWGDGEDMGECFCRLVSTDGGIRC